MSPSKYARKSKCREPVTFYLACEGTKTEPNYFSDCRLRKELLLTNLKIIVIEKHDTRSSPDHIIDDAVKYCKTNKIKPSKYDKICLVIDYDKWGDRKLKEINKLCRDKKYYLFVSNPCIELWFLLHKHDLKNNKNSFNKCKACKKEFSKIFDGDYGKLYPLTNQAIDNAKKIDEEAVCDWPDYVATKIYKLFDQMINE